MKSIFFTFSLFLAFTISALAQDEADKFQKQPPAVTQAQVEKDAALAQQERKKHEQEKKSAENEEKQRSANTQITPVPNNASTTKKTSTRPGKQ